MVLVLLLIHLKVECRKGLSHRPPLIRQDNLMFAVEKNRLSMFNFAYP